MLIDEWHGFHPYTTWSTTTNHNANELLAELRYDGEVSYYGVVRAYSTRHGPGPFPTEDRALTLTLPDTHNVHGTWQGGVPVDGSTCHSLDTRLRCRAGRTVSL